MRAASALILCAALLGACSKNTDPNTAAYWVDRLEDSQQRKEALKRIGRIGDATVVPEVVHWLGQEGEWQPDAAYTLGQLGDKSVVPKLLEAIDYDVGTGRDRTSRTKNRVNLNTVRALAMLKAHHAADAIVKLLDAAEPTVREGALRALGQIGNRIATDEIIKVALHDREPFLRKTAIQALGEMRDPRGVPALVRMLYVEVPGISFYNEASLSLIQVGTPAIPLLVETLNRKNEEVESIRLLNGDPIAEGAIEAKAAMVLGYLQSKQAESEMIKMLSHLVKRFSQAKGDTRLWASVPAGIMELCYALANLGTPAAKGAVRPLLNQTLPDLRAAAAESLTQLGDRDAVAALLKGARRGDLASRQSFLEAASRLGRGSDLAAFDAMAKVGDKQVSKKVMAQLVSATRVRLEAAKACQTDATCWRGKLNDPDPRVRDKAVWELGWMGGKEVTADLLKAAEDPDVAVRIAAVMSLARGNDISADQLQPIYDKWAKKLDYRRVNQLLQRVIARLSSK